MERLRQMLREDREKLRGERPSQVALYIWDYYRIPIMALLAVLAIGGYLLFLQLTVPKENWFYACFANTYADYGRGSNFYVGFADYAGYDLKEKNLVVNCTIYCNPSKRTMGNRYYDSLVTLMDAGALDVVVMGREDIEALGRAGRLLDLSSEHGQGLAERWADRLTSVVPEDTENYGSKPLPVAIDLDGSRVVGDYAAYAGDAWLGVNAESTHVDQVEVFLQYLFDTGSHDDKER